MNTTGVSNNLTQALKDLSAEWQQTRAYWRDTKSQQFAETYLETLPQHIARATSVIDEITVLLKKVRSDCE